MLPLTRLQTDIAKKDENNVVGKNDCVLFLFFLKQLQPNNEEAVPIDVVYYIFGFFMQMVVPIFYGLFL
jgi:hypothetical protein